MAVEVVPHRPTLVAELRRLGIEPRLLARATDPRVPDAWFAASASVAFWAEVLPWPAGDGSGGALPDAVFGAASAAYLDRWRAEREDQQLMAEARALARAARAHRPVH